MMCIWKMESKTTKYSIIKKEILSIVNYINKMQDDLSNKKFLLRIDLVMLNE